MPEGGAVVAQGAVGVLAADVGLARVIASLSAPLIADEGGREGIAGALGILAGAVGADAAVLYGAALDGGLVGEHGWGSALVDGAEAAYLLPRLLPSAIAAWPGRRTEDGRVVIAAGRGSAGGPVVSVLVPVGEGEEPVGALGLRWTASAKVWSDAMVPLLRIAGELFLAQLQRRASVAREAAARARFRAAFDAAPIGMAILGRDLKPTAVNAAFCRLLGFRADELLQRSLPSLLHPDEDLVQGRGSLAAALRRRRAGAGVAVERRLCHREGSVVVVELSATAPEGLEGTGELIVQAVDVTEQRRIEEQLLRRTLQDPLTGLATRPLLLDRTRRALGASPSAVAVLVTGLDRAEALREAFGREGLEALVREVGRRLAAVAPAAATVARVGADEFGVLVEGPPAEQPRELARLLQAAVADPIDVLGPPVRTTLSVGLRVLEGSPTAEELVREADAALEHARLVGPGAVQVFDPFVATARRDRADIDASLPAAVGSGELRCFVQPVVDLASGRLVGGEALLRWEHPRLGLLPPVAFIDAAERSGAIADMGAWMLQAACQATSELRARTGADLTVGVNLSPQQLGRGVVVARVRRCIEDGQLPPEALHLEITETLLVEGTAAVLAELRELAGMGVRLGIDDFGTGYASLSYLKRLPVDFLKIDRDFVAGLGSDRTDTAIVEATLALARALRLDVIAEGVETAEQALVLNALGCGLAQGHHWSRAVPLEQYAEIAAGTRPMATSG